MGVWRRSASTRGITAGVAESLRAQARGGEPDQVVGGEIAMFLGADAAALDRAEVGHGEGQGAGDDIHAPIEFLLVQMRQQRSESRRKIAQNMTVVVVEESAQAFILFGVGACKDAYERGAAFFVGGDVQGGADPRSQHIFELD